MGSFQDSKILVADVDCTGDGNSLCLKHGVKSYPTIKYGDPDDLQDYQGDRMYVELKKFAEENLSPTCRPDNLDPCSDDEKALIDKLIRMSREKLEAKIRKGEGEVERLEAAFNTLMEEEKKKKDDAIKKIAIPLMQAVHARAATAAEMKAAETKAAELASARASERASKAALKKRERENREKRLKKAKERKGKGKEPSGPSMFGEEL